MHSAWIRSVEEGDLMSKGEPCTEDCVSADCVVEVIAA